MDTSRVLCSFRIGATSHEQLSSIKCYQAPDHVRTGPGIQGCRDATDSGDRQLQVGLGRLGNRLPCADGLYRHRRLALRRGPGDDLVPAVGVRTDCAAWSDRFVCHGDVLLPRRLFRLGVPWILFTLLIWPFFMWLVYRAAGNDLSYWQAFRGRTPFLDSGPLWFVQVLLYVSLGYALWTRLGWGRRLRPAAITGRHLVVVAVAIATTSFVVRLWFPARSQQ